jgi:hypothetical protein
MRLGEIGERLTRAEVDLSTGRRGRRPVRVLRFGCGAAARLYWQATRRRVNGEDNDEDTEV